MRKNRRLTRFASVICLIAAPVASPISAQTWQESEYYKTCIAAWEPDSTTEAETSRSDDSEAQDKKKEAQSTALDRQEQALPLGLDGAAPTITSAVALVATDSGGRAKLSWRKRIQTSEGGSSDLTIEASAPFDEDESEGHLLSKSGLSGDFLATVSYSGFQWGLDPDTYVERLCRACDAANLDLLDCRKESLVEKWGEDLQQNPALSKEEADTEVNKRLEKLQQTFYHTTVGYLWGFEGSAGNKPRKYFELDGTTADEDRFGYSASLLGGVLFANNWSLYGKASWVRDFDENDKAELCTTVDDTPFMRCRELPLGRAEVDETFVLSAQVVRFFGEGLIGRPFAIAPAIGYDSDAEDWEAELPVYLVTNADGGFTGGVKAAWFSDEDVDWTFTVFITKPLQTWP